MTQLTGGSNTSTLGKRVNYLSEPSKEDCRSLHIAQSNKARPKQLHLLIMVSGRLETIYDCFDLHISSPVLGCSINFFLSSPQTSRCHKDSRAETSSCKIVLCEANIIESKHTFESNWSLQTKDKRELCLALNNSS